MFSNMWVHQNHQNGWFRVNNPIKVQDFRGIFEPILGHLHIEAASRTFNCEENCTSFSGIHSSDAIWIQLGHYVMIYLSLDW